MVFDEFDECGVAEDFGPEALAATSPRDFLEEEEDRFACFLGSGDSLVVVALPLDLPELDRGGVGEGGEKGEEKDSDHGLDDGCFSFRLEARAG